MTISGSELPSSSSEYGGGLRRQRADLEFLQTGKDEVISMESLDLDLVSMPKRVNYGQCIQIQICETCLLEKNCLRTS